MRLNHGGISLLTRSHSVRSNADRHPRPADPHGCDLREDVPGLALIASSERGWRAIEPGQPTASSGMMAARAIETAAALALEGRVDGIVTAPISKTALQAAGYPYPGHTEFLGALARVPG